MDGKQYEQRAKSYLFWLLEYRGRRFLHYVGYDGFELLKKLTPLYDLCFSAASYKGNENIQSFSEFIKSTHKNDIQFENSQHRGLCDYFEMFPDDYEFFGRTFGVLTTSEAIVALCKDKKVGEEIWYLLDGQGRNVSSTTIEAYAANGKETIPRHTIMPVENDKLLLHKVAVDLNAPLADILTDITSFVCAAREQAAIQELGDPSNEEMKKLFNDGCPGFGPCRNKCEQEGANTFFAKTLRQANLAKYKYTDRSDAARAVGIWLWDCMWLDGCIQAEAIRRLRDQGFLDALGFGNSDNRVLQRMHERTTACIEQGNVLTMS